MLDEVATSQLRVIYVSWEPPSPHGIWEHGEENLRLPQLQERQSIRRSEWDALGLKNDHWWLDSRRHAVVTSTLWPRGNLCYPILLMGKEGPSAKNSQNQLSDEESCLDIWWCLTRESLLVLGCESSVVLMYCCWLRKMSNFGICWKVGEPLNLQDRCQGTETHIHSHEPVVRPGDPMLFMPHWLCASTGFLLSQHNKEKANFYFFFPH